MVLRPHGLLGVPVRPQVATSSSESRRARSSTTARISSRADVTMPGSCTTQTVDGARRRWPRSRGSRRAARFIAQSLATADRAREASQHKGISVLIIPTDSPASPAARSACSSPRRPRLQRGLLDDVHVPASNLVGELNGGWGVANGSLGHERAMLWLGFATRLESMVQWGPVTLERAGAAHDPIVEDWFRQPRRRRLRHAPPRLPHLASAPQRHGSRRTVHPQAHGLRRAKPPTSPSSSPSAPPALDPDLPAPQVRPPVPVRQRQLSGTSTSAASPAPSPAAPAKSNATSSPRGFWGFRGRRRVNVPTANEFSQLMD